MLQTVTEQLKGQCDKILLSTLGTGKTCIWQLFSAGNTFIRPSLPCWNRFNYSDLLSDPVRHIFSSYSKKKKLWFLKKSEKADTVVKLVGGGSVTNGATLFSFIMVGSISQNTLANVNIVTFS